MVVSLPLFRNSGKEIKMKHGFGFGVGFARCSHMGVLGMVCTLMACGGGGNSASTPQEAVAQLEASGDLPKLEREPTLGGIDVNGDGVRDDIEQYIVKKYSEPAQRKAAMQTAEVFQKMLLVDKSDVAALDAVSEAGSRAIVCAKAAFATSDGAIEQYRMNTDLESMTANTKARLIAYLAYNKARNGTVSTMPPGDTCD